MIEFELRDGAGSGDLARQMKVEERLRNDDRGRTARRRVNAPSAMRGPRRRSMKAAPRGEHENGRGALGRVATRTARESEQESAPDHHAYRVVSAAVDLIPNRERLGPDRKEERDLHAAEERPRKRQHRATEEARGTAHGKAPEGATRPQQEDEHRDARDDGRPPMSSSPVSPRR